ncbi:uncharacterized protein LOC129582054 [Paramacrobiotus metropolitanus]|uniref:uncharacterized protein LOC129582054 n=1 Tax=Paramacrobiotus metropolitanus TaxID=2943436 RepID=UPI0024464449|nr:uncharacterized protein LOC129582054 [Paramacrobiotus metropolitanus]
MGICVLIYYVHDIVSLVYNTANFFEGAGFANAGSVVFLKSAQVALRTTCFVYLSDKVEEFTAAFRRILLDKALLESHQYQGHHQLALNSMQSNPPVMSLGSCARLNRQTVITLMGLYLTYLLLSYDRSDTRCSETCNCTDKILEMLHTVHTNNSFDS